MACMEIVFTSFLAFFLFMQKDGSLVTLEEKTHWWISNPSKGLHIVLFYWTEFSTLRAKGLQQEKGSLRTPGLSISFIRSSFQSSIFNFLHHWQGEERRGMGGAAECTARWDGGEWYCSKCIDKRIKVENSEFILSCLYVRKRCHPLRTYHQ